MRASDGTDVSSVATMIRDGISGCRVDSEDPHVDARKEQKGTEHVQDRAELADQRGAGPDHDGAHQDHAQDAPEQRKASSETTMPTKVSQIHAGLPSKPDAMEGTRPSKGRP